MWTRIIFFLLAVTLPALRARPDDDEPCPDLDVECVRNHMISNSNCQVRTFKKIPNKVTISNIRFKVPFFNVSHVDQYVTTTNLDKCRITGFIVNQTTRETILQLDCENLRIDALRAFFVHTAGESDSYYVVKVTGDYALARLSINIRGLNSIDICRSTSIAWVTHPTLLFVGQDRASVDFVRKDPREIFGLRTHTWVREIWSYRATTLLRYWINNFICDFECNICEE